MANKLSDHLKTPLDEAREKVIRINGPAWFNDWFDRHDEIGAKLKEKYGADFASNTKFLGVAMTVAEAKAAEEWVAGLYNEICKTHPHLCENGHVYYGATGGGVSITITPTSLGPIYVIKEALTGKELNLCEATDWYFYG